VIGLVHVLLGEYQILGQWLLAVVPRVGCLDCVKIGEMEGLTVAIALSPATPAPITRTLQGGI
jgi:hypothetical protein